jgi:hypothetical protein
MSNTYFFGFDASRTGVWKVLFSFQYSCHFFSVSANGYVIVVEEEACVSSVVVAAVVVDSVVVEAHLRKAVDLAVVPLPFRGTPVLIVETVNAELIATRENIIASRSNNHHHRTTRDRFDEIISTRTASFFNKTTTEAFVAPLFRLTPSFG